MPFYQYDSCNLRLSEWIIAYISIVHFGCLPSSLQAFGFATSVELGNGWYLSWINNTSVPI